MLNVVLLGFCGCCQERILLFQQNRSICTCVAHQVIWVLRSWIHLSESETALTTAGPLVMFPARSIELLALAGTFAWRLATPSQSDVAVIHIWKSRYVVPKLVR